MYIGDWGNHRIRIITVSTSIITTIAGTGSYGFSGDGGAATAAAIAYPAGVNLDSAGNVYFGDFSAYNVIRKVTVSTGVISTVAGAASTSGGFNGDDIQATAASLYNPFDVVLDSYNNLYISDRYNNRIRKVDVSTGVITTVVGTGTSSSTGDGSAATSANTNGPCFSRFDSLGNYYISECEGNLVRKVVTVTTDIPTITPSTQPTYYPSLSPHSISVISTIAGTGTASYSGDGGQASSAVLNNPEGIAIDSSGNVYVTDRGNHRVRKITSSTGIITTYAGTGTASYSGDGGVATSAALNYPVGLCIDTSGITHTKLLRLYYRGLMHSSLGNMYIGDQVNARVRKVVASTGIITTYAGSGSGGYSGDNGPATAAALLFPTGVAVDTSGNLFVTDTLNNRVRKVTASTSVITTFAGTGVAGYSGDGGAATAAAVTYPHGVNLDGAGNVYFGDWDAVGGGMSYNVIRKVTISTGIISTVAGVPSTSGGYNGDNIQATAAMLNSPVDAVVDSSGNLFITDYYNNRIRKVTVSTGVITTIVGTGTASSTGDGSAATSATINQPCFSRFDSSGNYYVSEYTGNRVRKVVTVTTDIPTSYPSLSPHSVSVISTIAGTGKGSYSGDNGQASSATVANPEGLAIDSLGNVYIADTYNLRIRKITISTGIITTIAGSTTSGSFSGDNGPATSAALNVPTNIAVDSSGSQAFLTTT